MKPYTTYTRGSYPAPVKEAIILAGGLGTRLRESVPDLPKCMAPVAGRPFLFHVINHLRNEGIERIIFSLGYKHEVIEAWLREAFPAIDMEIVIEEEPLGTAHAILCAGDFLEGNLIVAFADTLFRSEFKIDASKDGIIWVQKVDNPSAFGVVKLDKDGVITEFVEKPKDFVSDLAIIGIYYFKDGVYLRKEMQYLIDKGIKQKGEYWLTDAMENMKAKGTRFYKGEVIEWLDCGNKDATVYTNQRVLEFIKDGNNVSSKAVMENSVVLHPCYIEDDVIIKNSVIGPHVSIGKGTVIENCVVKNSIIQGKTTLKNKLIANSMIGNSVRIEGKMDDFSIGDHNVLLD